MKKFSIILTFVLALSLVGCATLNLPENSDFTKSDEFWKIGNYVDGWGRKTEKQYLYSEFIGTFSNSATRNSNMRGVMKIDPYSIFSVEFKIYEYGDYLATGIGDNDWYYVTFGNATTTATLHSDGSFNVDYNKQEIIDELAKGKEIQVRISGGKYTTSTYYFVVNGNGFAEKFSKIAHIENKSKEVYPEEAYPEEEKYPKNRYL